MAKGFQVSTIFKAVDRFTRPLGRMSNGVNRFARNAEAGLRRVSRSTDKVAKGITKTAKAMTAASAIVLGGFSAASAAGIEFEQTLVSAAVKFPGQIRKGTAAFEELSAAAQLVGSTTEFSASQAASGLNFMAMAGFDAKQSIAALPGVIDLATAAGVDLARASDIATDTLGAFGLASDDAAQQATNLARVTDVLAKTSTSSNTSIEQLFSAVTRAGPVAVLAGQDIETLSAAIGVMADAGIKADVAGTAMKNALLNLSSPSANAAKVISRLGLQTKDANGQLLDLPDIIDGLNDATKDLADPQRVAVFETLFGREGLAGIANVVSAGGDAFRDFRTDLRGASGTSKEMAAVMRDTTKGAIAGLKSAIEGVNIALFEYSGSPMRQAIDVTTEWVRANSDLIALKLGTFLLSIAENIDTIVSVGSRLAMVAGGFLAINAALKLISGTMGVIAALTAANPIGLAALAIAAAATAIFVAWEPLKAFFNDLFNSIADTYNNTVGKVMAKIEVAKNAIGGILGISGDTDRTPTAREFAAGGGASPVLHTPTERVTRTIQESNTTQTAEVVIKDETGQAEATKQGGRDRAKVRIQNTGGFYGMAR